MTELVKFNVLMPELLREAYDFGFHCFGLLTRCCYTSVSKLSKIWIPFWPSGQIGLLWPLPHYGAL